MVKLTPELIKQSMENTEQYRERELDLRGNKIPQIENLGATFDQFDTIDLSDNELIELDGIAHLPRLKSFLVSNNRIWRIKEGLQQYVPNLRTLILTGNNLQHFADIEPLAMLPKLETLCLLGNPVCKLMYYRKFVPYKFPQLHLLDFWKIRPKDRKAAQEFFASKEGEELLKKIADDSKLSAAGKMGPTGSEKSESATASAEVIKRH